MTPGAWPRGHTISRYFWLFQKALVPELGLVQKNGKKNAEIKEKGTFKMQVFEDVVLCVQWSQTIGKKKKASAFWWCNPEKLYVLLSFTLFFFKVTSDLLNFAKK